MFVKVSTASKDIFVNIDHILALVPYEEIGKPCGCEIHWTDRKMKPVWVMNNVEEIIRRSQKAVSK